MPVEHYLATPFFTIHKNVSVMEGAEEKFKDLTESFISDKCYWEYVVGTYSFPMERFYVLLFNNNPGKSVLGFLFS